MLDREIIYRLPKIDLHRHLDGDVRPEVLFKLARKEGVELPADNPESLGTYFKGLRAEGFGSLLQKGFGLVTSLMQSKENLGIVAYEGVRNLKNDNIIYGEFRFAPQYHTGESAYYSHSAGKSKKNLSYEEIIKAVADGLRKGEKEFGVKTNLIICIGREAGPEVGIKVAKAAINCVDCGVVALDLACDESRYPPERHTDAYRATFKTSLRRTVHAGEAGNRLYDNIMISIKELKADRLGHAIPLSKHEDLIELVADRRIGIEMCPESNIFVGLIKSRKEHDIPMLLSRNVLISVNSDDPAMFGYTLTDTVHRLATECDFNIEDLKKLQINAIETAFLKPVEKSKLMKIIESKYKVL